MLAAEEIGSVAVVCINSYANPAHELEIADLLREHGFEGEISLSHVVSGEYREYERASTTVIDAYIRPLMTRYLGGLAERLRGLGLGERLFVTSSGGGAMSFAEAGARPFETISSGPAGGAVGAAALCARLGLPAAITADVGGTSFDTCFIENGRPRVAFEGHVADLVIQAPWIDVRSVGAGGGSIAWVDPSGLLRVGPASAGADPGPASYGRGGDQPTVTDAALVLGMLAFGDLADDVRLDRDRALAALEPLGSALGMEVDAVARGVLSIANARMADAIREVLGEQGQDPRDAALIAFGGAGPLFATLLASELEITKIVVPAHAGNFSAWGLLQQDILQSAARTSVANLDAAGIEATNRVLDELFDQLAQRPSPTSSSRKEAALDMRYAGQDYTLTVAVPLADGRLPGGYRRARGRVRARIRANLRAQHGSERGDRRRARLAQEPARGGDFVPRGRRRVHSGTVAIAQRVLVRAREVGDVRGPPTCVTGRRRDSPRTRDRRRGHDDRLRRRGLRGRPRRVRRARDRAEPGRG